MHMNLDGVNLLREILADDKLGLVDTKKALVIARSDAMSISTMKSKWAASFHDVAKFLADSGDVKGQQDIRMVHFSFPLLSHVALCSRISLCPLHRLWSLKLEPEPTSAGNEYVLFC